MDSDRAAVRNVAIMVFVWGRIGWVPATLENYIFVGLQTSNVVSSVFGCLLSAGLALVLDGLLHSLELAVALRSSHRAALTLMGLILVAMTHWLLQWLPVRGVGATPIARRTEIVKDRAVGPVHLFVARTKTGKSARPTNATVIHLQI